MASLFDYYNTGDDDSQTVSATLKLAQTFTTSQAYQITSVKIKGYKSGAPGTLTAAIRATSGGIPTGGNLASGTTNADAFTSSSPGAWYEVTLDTPLEIAASTKYGLCLFCGSTVSWRWDAGGGYAGGNAYWSNNGGSTWNINSTGDHMFEIWGVAIGGAGGQGGSAPVLIAQGQI